MKLSYRDKVIFVAAIVIIIIVAGIFVFIKPKFEEMNYAKSALQAKQSEQADVEAKINTLPDIVAALKSAAQDVGEIQEYFMPEQDPYLNEQYVREILGKNVTVRGMNTQYTSADDIEQYVVNAQNIAACDIFIDSDLYNELPQEVYDAYNKAKEKDDGLPKIRIHDFRHSHASFLINNMAGAKFSDFDIAKRLGDTVETLHNTYAHWFDTKDKSIVDMMNKLL